jgi:hypothetical protein
MGNKLMRAVKHASREVTLNRAHAGRALRRLVASRLILSCQHARRVSRPSPGVPSSIFNTCRMRSAIAFKPPAGASFPAIADRPH